MGKAVPWVPWLAQALTGWRPWVTDCGACLSYCGCAVLPALYCKLERRISILHKEHMQPNIGYLQFS